MFSHAGADELPEGRERVSWPPESSHKPEIYLHEYPHLEKPVARHLQTRSVEESQLLGPKSIRPQCCPFPMESESTPRVHCQIVGGRKSGVDLYWND